MKFSLRNILLVIAFLAIWLGLLLSDDKIRERAVALEESHRLIDEAQNYHLPISDQEVQTWLSNKSWKLAEASQN